MLIESICEYRISNFDLFLHGIQQHLELENFSKLLKASCFFELEDDFPEDGGPPWYLNLVPSRTTLQQVPRVVIDETIKEPDAKEILDELDTWAERDFCCIVFFFGNHPWF